MLKLEDFTNNNYPADFILKSYDPIHVIKVLELWRKEILFLGSSMLSKNQNNYQEYLLSEI